MSEILDLIESGKIKEAMNTIKKNDRIRGNDIRLGQALINNIYKAPQENQQDIISEIFYLEDREFLKLIFE